jgi:hypothetical protein
VRRDEGRGEREGEESERERQRGLESDGRGRDPVGRNGRVEMRREEEIDASKGG